MFTYPFRLPFDHPFSSSFELAGFGAPLLPPCFSQILAWHPGLIEGEIYVKDYAKSLGDFPLVMVDGPCLTLDGVVDKCTTSTDHGTIISYEGTSTLAYDGTDLTGTAGTFYNLLFSDGTHFPCIGKTATVNPTSTFATDGTEMTIVSSDYAAIWVGTQDSYFYEMRFGYWDDVNGRYPYAKSGATFHPGNTWNNPMNKFAYSTPGTPAPADIIAMDAVHQLYTDGAGNSIALTQAEILAGCNLNAQYFFDATKAKGLANYATVQVDPCLGQALVWFGEAEYITVGGEFVTVDGEKVWVRI